MTTNNEKSTAYCHPWCNHDHNPKPSLKDRLASVNAGDTLTVIDVRGDVWTGVVRPNQGYPPGLLFGVGRGSVLRYCSDGNPGRHVTDIRDHVPAVIDTPEPTKPAALVRCGGGEIWTQSNAAFEVRWMALRPSRAHTRRWADLTQPVTLIFEGDPEV